MILMFAIMRKNLNYQDVLENQVPFSMISVNRDVKLRIKEEECLKPGRVRSNS